MPDPALRKATWADMVNTPEDGNRYEILDGELSARPRPRPVHGRVQALISAELVKPFDRGTGGPGGWWIVVEPDVELEQHEIVNPDLVGWRRERMPVLPETPPVRVVPDWVCEVSSPSTARRDRLTKADLYLQAGVPHYWIVSTDDRLLEAFEAREGAWLRLGGWTDGDVARVRPFDAIEIDVGGLFPPQADAVHEPAP